MAVAIFLNASAVRLCQSLRSRVRALTPLLLTVMTLPSPVADLPKVMAASRPGFEARLLLPSFIFQNKIFLPGPPSADNVISVLKTIHREAPFRQLSKVADASQPLEFEKLSSLRVYRFS